MTENSLELQHKEKTAQLLWTGIILSFFLIQAIIWTVAISITANDRSHAVIADYDRKALHWDQEIALRNASARLGWEAEIDVATDGDLRGNRTITISLKDKNKSPVSGASIELNAFHRAVAAEPQMISFSETEKGTYTGIVQVRKGGRWQFDGAVRRGSDTFLIQQTQSLTLEN